MNCMVSQVTKVMVLVAIALIQVHALLTLPHQQLFLDTASITSWEEHIPLGIFYGITTNPVLLERANEKCDMNNLKRLSRIALDDMKMNCFMLQTWGHEKDQLISIALALQEMSDRIVVKVPLTKEGIKAASILSKMNVRLCMTACYTPHQVFTSAALNAEYVAPYLGRMTDTGKHGIDEIIKMQRIVEGLNSDTRVFVASLRHPNQLATLAAEGLHTFTFSPQIADGLVYDPLTVAAAEDFERAAGSSNGDN
jgi:transaldolase